MSHYWILHIPHAGAVLGIVEADWFYENHMRISQDINIGNPILVSFFCMCAALSSVSIPSFPKLVSFCLYFPLKHSGYIFSSRISICLQDPTLLELKKEGDEKFQVQLYEVAAAIYTFIEINYPSMDTVIAEKLFHKRAVCFYKMVSFLF